MSNSGKAILAGVIMALATSPLLADTDAKIKARLEKLLPEYTIDSIGKTPIGGLFEVVMGPEVIYVSSDGKYMLQGRLIDLENREDLTEPRRAAARKEAVAKIGEDNMVIFAPDDYKHTVTVFTDIDCGYCRKLHREIADYEAEGVRIRYVFFPRAGLGSDSYKKAVAVWCSDDRRKALTDAKAGKDIEAKSCKNPVKDHMKLGELLGVTGTPSILLETGEMVPGYVPAKRLAALLEAKKK
ncbi:MAG: DsbC family protein [Chromatiaceae bacterium]|jgi:thiol:disulfide interchange protein DsbC|nr:DsbC family protein [Chromatiaceae bacterium]